MGTEVINIIINNLFLVMTAGFMILYLVSMIINLIRATKVLKDLKKNPKVVKGVIVDIAQDKKYTFIKVKYTSPSNHQVFTDTIQMTNSDFNDQYYVDQEVDVRYPDPTKLKRIYYFPKFIGDQKIKIEAGPLFTDALLVASGIFIFCYVLYQMIATEGAFTGKVPLIAGGLFQTTQTQTTGVFSTFAVLASIVIYVILFSYVLERLISASVEHTHNYLKLCGIQCTAKVVTYKFGRSKDAKGNKESQMKIEFYDNGELIQANLNSYLYTETQDEYIKILYDPKNPKTTVYIR